MPKVVVGATGGLRKALAQGIVSETQVQTFAEVLSSTFKGHARLARLTGEEEAELELKAVRYIADHSLGTFRPNFGGGYQRISTKLGVLSCGGASSQVAYYPRLEEAQDKQSSNLSSTTPQFLSLNTNLVDTIALAKSYGHQTWTGPAFAYTEDLMWKRIAEAGAHLGKLCGTFLVIELAGSIGKEAGLADRLVPKREAVQLLTQHLESMQRIAGKDLKIRSAEDAGSKHLPESVSFFQQARIPLTIITLALLDLFSSKAFFYFATSFRIGPEDNILRTQWPLGFFLKDARIGGIESERSKL